MTSQRFFVVFLLGIVVCQEKKSVWNRESAAERLDDVITVEFKARDANNDSILTTKEIREYYESHPEKMSKEGITFLDKNFSNGSSVNIDQYREIIKNWLAHNGSAEKILVGMFGNNTKHLQSHHVWHPKTTTVSPSTNVSKTTSVSP